MRKSNNFKILLEAIFKQFSIIGGRCRAGAVLTKVPAHYNIPTCPINPIFLTIDLFLSAALRSKAPIMFYLCLFYLFIFFNFFIHRSFSETTRPILTKIFRNCIFWCSLNNAVVLKFF